MSMLAALPGLAALIEDLVQRVAERLDRGELPSVPTLPARKSELPKLAVLGNGVWAQLAAADAGTSPELAAPLVALRTALGSGRLLLAFTSGNLLGAAPFETLVALSDNHGLL